MSPEILLTLKVIDMVLLGATLIPEMRGQLMEVRDKLMSMQAEGRNPTPAEWAELTKSVDNKIVFIMERSNQ